MRVQWCAIPNAIIGVFTELGAQLSVSVHAKKPGATRLACVSVQPTQLEKLRDHGFHSTGPSFHFFWLNREVDGQAAVLQNFDDGILQPVIAQQLLGMPRFKMEPQRSRKPLERASTMNEDIGDGVKE